MSTLKKHYLLTPGPTPIPPEAALKSALPILHHRTSEFGEIFLEVLKELKYVFQTEHDVLLLTSSGTGAMEAAVANLLSPGDKAIVVSCGVFGERWAKILKAFGIEPVVVRAEWGKAVNPADVEKALEQTPEAKAVYTTHAETSTGTVNDIKVLGRIVSATDAVLIVDAISGLVGQELRMDEWKVDGVIAGSQKGLMNAPGLAFACFNDKAWELVEKAQLPRFYFDLRNVKKKISDKQTPYTPAVTLIVSLQESLRMIKQETLENIWARHEKLARATRTGMKAIGLELFSESPSNVVTPVKVPSGIDGDKLVKKLRTEYGVSIAGGQETLKGKIFRIAHMGYMNQFDIFVGLCALEISLEELGYEVQLGKAVGAAEKEFRM